MPTSYYADPAIATYFKLLSESLKKTNPNLKLRKFLRQQGITFNVQTGALERNLRTFTNLFITINKLFANQKEQEIRFLKEKVERLKYLIEKITREIFSEIDNFISNHPQEKESLEKLVEAKFKLEELKRKKQPLAGFSKECTKLKLELLDSISEEFLEKILDDCAKWVELKIELEKEEELLIRWEKKQLPQINITGDINVNNGHLILGSLFGDNVDLGYNGFVKLPQEKTAENLITRIKRQLSLETQNKTNQGEAKTIKLNQEEFYSEPMEIEENRDWQSVHPSFTLDLIQLWINHGFTSKQTQEWLNILPLNQQNQASQEPAFYAWLRDIKQLTPEQVLNHHRLNSLKQEYQSQQQAYIQQTNLPPRNS